MTFKKIGHFNIIKNNKNILRNLYIFKKSFFIYNCDIIMLISFDSFKDFIKSLKYILY